MPSKRSRSKPASQQYAEGVATYGRGCYEQAIRQLEGVRQEAGLLGQMADYYQSMARRALGIEALRDGRFAEAEKCFLQAARTVGRNAGLASYLAALYARQGSYAKCVHEMSHAVEAESDDAAAWRKLAQAQWRAGQRDEARMTLTAALRKLGSRAELHIQMGLFWAAADKFNDARKSFASAVDADCTNPDAHYYLALAAAGQGDAIDAVRSFQRAFELRPCDLIVARQLATAAAAAERQGRHFVLHLPEEPATWEGSEVRQLAGYVAAEPESLDAYLSLPESPVDQELFGTLAGVVQMALVAHGGYADLHHYCSRTFDRLGRPEEAIEHAEAAIEINPSYVQALLHLGRLYARRGRFAEAVTLVSRAIACGADWPDVHCLTGEIMVRLDMSAEARKHFERALQLNAGYARAAEAISRLAA